jgi:hypothetical protein
MAKYEKECVDCGAFENGVCSYSFDTGGSCSLWCCPYCDSGDCSGYADVEGEEK